MHIYLLQLKVEIDGKQRVLKYIGQTINFEQRKKQHYNSFFNKPALTDKNFKLYEYILHNFPYYWNGVNNHDKNKNLKEILDKSKVNGWFKMDIVYTAKTKNELDCAEKAWQYIIRPELNSYFSEANCYDIGCPICNLYADWTMNPYKDFRRCWTWPLRYREYKTGHIEKDTTRETHLRKKLHSKLKQSKPALTYIAKMKTGWIPKNLIKGWE